MIQRIQTVYLLISVTLTIVFSFLTLGYFEIGGSNYFLKVTGLFYQDKTELLFQEPNLSLSAMVLFSLLLTVSAILNFKNRPLQIRLISLSIVANLAAIGLIYFAQSVFSNTFSDGNSIEISYTFSSIIPLITIAFLILAMRGIKKDEKLVKSLDRIR